MKILVMGGTRFVGKAIVRKLLEKGHDLSLFTRGNRSVPNDLTHFKGDRKSIQDLNQLSNHSFDSIIDCSGRELDDTKNLLLTTGTPSHRYVYISSAGVYANNQLWPLNENSTIDPSSRHIGKFHTENWLKENSIPFTSFRPTYIYGPYNYNPIESWFFDRITHSKLIPLPGDGQTITQLGHVSDLADAITLSLEKEICVNEIYNCSGSQGITFNGLIDLCVKTCSVDINSLRISQFDINKLNPKSRKVFPLRISHFLTDISKIQNHLSWTPKYDLQSGLRDSYLNDYKINKKSKPDLSQDELLPYF